MEASKSDYYDRHDTRPRPTEAQSRLKDASRRMEKYRITAVPSCPTCGACRTHAAPSVTHIIPIGTFDVESKDRREVHTHPPVGFVVV